MFGPRSHQGSSRVLPPAIMAVSGLSLYVGAALAVGLFDHFPPVVVAWFRIATAGLILWAFFRPRASSFIGRPALIATFFGVAAMAMNMTFYMAIQSIPLGSAVAIEFIGPVIVAAWGSRRLRDWLALGFAIAGVLVISGAQWSAEASGILWALAAGGFWAGYILLGAKISSNTDTSKSSLAVGFTYAGVLGLPLAIWLWPENLAMAAPTIIGLAAGLGLLSAAIPYSLDQVVLRLAGSSLFALLQAVLPLVATLVGAVALKQWISLTELAGIALVIFAIVLRKP